MKRYSYSKTWRCWSLFFVLLHATSVYAQTTSAKNFVYVEFFGPGILYSINYERLFNDHFSLRLGYSAWSFSFLGSGSFTGLPLMVNYLVGDGNHRFELGVGIENTKIDITNFFGLNENASTSHILGIFSICYRYQPRDGGIHLRIGATPLLFPTAHDNKFIFYFGASMGFCF